MAVRQTQDQKRAREAWEAVRAVTKRSDSVRQEYRALARGFAAMIQVNGFGPACAFLYAKKNREQQAPKNGERKEPKGPGAHELLLGQLQSWLRQQPWLQMDEHKQGQEEPGQELGQETDQDWLMRWITTASSVEYRRAMVETLAYLLWLRRFAEGAIEETRDEPAGADKRGGAANVAEAVGKERE